MSRGRGTRNRRGLAIQPVDSVQLAANVLSQPNPTNLANDALALLAIAASEGDIDIRPEAIVVDNAGGVAGGFLRLPGVETSFTLGHAVFSEGVIKDPTFEHEKGHVAQYELLGAGFLPAYGVAQVIAQQQAPPGVDSHDHNFFEYSIDDWGWWQ